MGIEKNISISKLQLKNLEKKYNQKIISKIKKDGCEVVKSLRIMGITNISYPIFDNSGSALACLTMPFLHRLYEKTSDSSKASLIIKKYSLQLSEELGFLKK